MWQAQKCKASEVNDYCRYSGSYNIDAVELIEQNDKKTNALVFSKRNDFIPTNKVRSGDILIVGKKTYTVGVVRPEDLYDEDNYKDLKNSFNNFFWI